MNPVPRLRPSARRGPQPVTSRPKLSDESRRGVGDVIEQAKGIIMGERRCTAEEAFRILTKLSQDTNRKLRDVAAALVARAITPDP